MFEKLKDGANKLKAKIGGDDLDEKLVEVVSEENWQASTQQLHEIASAAYNYEKWQRINEFIWDKLKKSKSWKKILKTFNLIEFLLKNGPPSIISNFKYDLYQLRTFESYSSYVEGLDKGQPIRERAKVVVSLLGNEELLQEERVKAKNIREKMANVVGGNAYSGGYGNSGSSYGGSGGYGGSGYGGSGYGGNGGYGGAGSYGKNEQKKKPENKTYDYGNSLGAYGDYTYNKSTLDKYKDAKNDKSSNSTSDPAKEEKQPEIKADTRKPFEKVASKLSKPGEKKEVQAPVSQPVTNNTSYTAPTAATNTATSNGSGNIIDIFDFGSGPTPPAVQAPTQPPPQTQQPFTFNEPARPAPQVVQPPVQTQAPLQLPPQAPLYPPQAQGYPQGVAPQTGYPPQAPQQFPQYPPQPGQFQQPFPNQYGLNQYGQPNQFPPQQPPFNQYGQYPQQAPFGGQPQYPYQQPQYPAAQQAQYNPYAAMQQPPNPAYKPSGNLNAGITLSTTATSKKEDDFGNFSSSTSTAQNVNWLSSTEKGLLDFSDFGSELKKEAPKQNKQEVSNNIQIDAWSW